MKEAYAYCGMHHVVLDNNMVVHKDEEILELSEVHTFIVQKILENKKLTLNELSNIAESIEIVTDSKHSSKNYLQLAIDDLIEVGLIQKHNLCEKQKSNHFLHQ